MPLAVAVPSVESLLVSTQRREGPRLAAADERCEMFARLPRVRRAACAGEPVGVTLEKSCARSLAAVWQRGGLRVPAWSSGRVVRASSRNATRAVASPVWLACLPLTAAVRCGRASCVRGRAAVLRSSVAKACSAPGWGRSIPGFVRRPSGLGRLAGGRSTLWRGTCRTTMRRLESARSGVARVSESRRVQLPAAGPSTELFRP